MYDTVIIDPASTEFNRGSFCYLPYIFYSACKDSGNSVYFMENFTTADIDNIPEAKEYFVALWSYPQIDICLVLKRFMKIEPLFFGYTKLIEELNLPSAVIEDNTIKKGILAYPKYYKDFKYLLLSDCDMHLNKYGGTVYPFFTSYGCPNGCSFCPSTINCNKSRVVPKIEDIFKSLEIARKQNITNFHFTDEDFFWDIDRTYEILDWFINDGLDYQLIAMGHVGNVLKFIEKYGVELLEKAGVKLIEVGFETANDKLAESMGKVSLGNYMRLVETFAGTDINIFWLTLTFFPGETLKTLNQTGEFLKECGHKIEDLYGRIQTNSTEGGLGQFFQFYPGVKGYEGRKIMGNTLSDRPIRLIPSFIPDSFLDDRIAILRKISLIDWSWFQLYKLPNILCNIDLKEVENCNVFEAVKYFIKKELCTKEEGYIFLAICARLCIITSI